MIILLVLSSLYAQYLLMIGRTLLVFSNLPIKEPSDIPDPYVKLYVLPKKDNSNTKRKTEVRLHCRKNDLRNLVVIFLKNNLHLYFSMCRLTRTTAIRFTKKHSSTSWEWQS